MKIPSGNRFFLYAGRVIFGVGFLLLFLPKMLDGQKSSLSIKPVAVSQSVKTNINLIRPKEGVSLETMMKAYHYVQDEYSQAFVKATEDLKTLKLSEGAVKRDRSVNWLVRIDFNTPELANESQAQIHQVYQTQPMKRQVLLN